MKPTGNLTTTSSSSCSSGPKRGRVAALQPRHARWDFWPMPAMASEPPAAARPAVGSHLPLVDRLCPDRDDWLELVQHLEIGSRRAGFDLPTLRRRRRPMSDLRDTIELSLDASGVETGVGRARHSLESLGNAASSRRKSCHRLQQSSAKAAPPPTDRARHAPHGPANRARQRRNGGGRPQHQRLTSKRARAVDGVATASIQPYIDKLRAAEMAQMQAAKGMQNMGISAARPPPPCVACPPRCRTSWSACRPPAAHDCAVATGQPIGQHVRRHRCSGQGSRHLPAQLRHARDRPCRRRGSGGWRGVFGEQQFRCAAGQRSMARAVPSATPPTNCTPWPARSTPAGAKRQ